MLPYVSVIVPVYNDARRLALCLRALQGQTYPRADYEVIVVDNASDEPLAEVVGRFGQARLCREERPGSYAARNRGLSAARGEVIAFTDADCVPRPDWIERGVGELQADPACGLVAGEIELFFRDPRRPTPVELYEGLTALTQRDFVERGQFGATANLFTWRRVVERVGPFDAAVKSGGDVEFGQRVAAAGYRVRYAETARVGHPARRSFRELYARVTRIIGGVHDARGKKDRRFLGIDRGWLADLAPPVLNALQSWRSDRLRTVADKFKVIAVHFFVRYAEAWERLRLRLGGRSRR